MSTPDFQRSLLTDLVEVGTQHPQLIQVLVGPRQVGKTTLARQWAASVPFASRYASADAPLPPGSDWVETHWRLAHHDAAATGGPVLLVLDEIQKVSGWSEAVKRLWDERLTGGSDLRLLVLGSSALLVQAGLTESMTGRFYLHRCPHWSWPECRDAFGWSLDRWLYFGGYPGAAVLAGHVDRWKQYVTDSLIETVLARDVLQLQRVAKPALLRHLFLLAAAYPAQILSYTKMLGQLHDAGNTTTLAHYLTLLESAFLATGLPAFARGQARRRASSPKLVLWNNALVSALGPLSFEDALGSSEWWGRLVENAAGAHLLNGLPPAAFRVSYWRRGDDEVDFVVERGRQVLAIEVKSGRPRGGRGLSAFGRLYPDARVLIVGGEGMPLEEFFGAAPAALLGHLGA